MYIDHAAIFANEMHTIEETLFSKATKKFPSGTKIKVVRRSKHSDYDLVQTEDAAGLWWGWVFNDSIVSYKKI